MIAYRDAVPVDAAPFATAARQCFIETFGHLYAPHDLATFLEGWSDEAFRGELEDPRFHIRLATDDERIAGFAKLGPPDLPVEPREAQLWQLYVLQPWQGTGVAAALMDWALAQARADGHACLHLSVFVDNHRARRFYARYGAVDVGRYDFPVGDQIDEDRILRIDL